MSTKDILANAFVHVPAFAKFHPEIYQRITSSPEPAEGLSSGVSSIPEGNANFILSSYILHLTSLSYLITKLSTT